MKYDETTILIPSHSLDDFPTELPDDAAAGLLNSFCVAWHPRLLAATGSLPAWHPADDPPDTIGDRLILVPTVSEDWLPTGWSERVADEGGVLVTGTSDRGAMVREALEPLDRSIPASAEFDSNLVGDFFALGFCYLQIELLTRNMHYYSSLDEVYVQREAVAAAEAALADDSAAAREHLRVCFESLTETREQFYPVDCFLIDLCLVLPRLADEEFARTLSEPNPANLMLTAKDLEQIAMEKPSVFRTMREAWDREAVDMVGGDFDRDPSPVLPMESVLWNLRRGRQVFHRQFGREPTTWGRRRYGLATMMPQVLKKFGYQGALHFLLDDGVIPDTELSTLRWEGCDGTVIDAMSRIPLMADKASDYLLFPIRMSASMEEDQAAAIVLWHWPKVTAPWFEDIQRMQAYSPVLGRFITLKAFFEQTDTPGRLSSFNAKDYVPPFLEQHVTSQEPDPISRYTGHFLRRQRLDAACWQRQMAAVLGGRPCSSDEDDTAERIVEEAGPEGERAAVKKAEELLDTLSVESARSLADVVMHSAGDEPGYFLANPLSFPRRVLVELPDAEQPPAVEVPVKAVQFDGSRKTVLVDIPGSGFAWIPATGIPASSVKPTKVPLAENGLLRNEFFEVHVNERTGGLQAIKTYQRSSNRLSQQVAFRFPQEKTIRQEQDGNEIEIETWYSEMRCLTSEVTCRGPALGEIVTAGEIVDPTDDSKLAAFRQTFRVWRGKPVLEIEIELDIERPPTGKPWSSYFASRFAWDNPAASLTRSVLGGAQAVGKERFESPHYLEIADEQQRTTILNLGLPYHRTTGLRMLDSLLATAGETARHSRFVIAIDEDYPMQAALDAMTPVVPVPTESGPPRIGRTGWFFHVDCRNVQITRIMELMDLPEIASEDLAVSEQPPPSDRPPGQGFAVRLVETEGRRRNVLLRCFKTPTKARQRDFEGRTITDLTIERDGVRVEMTAYEIADVELRFDTQPEKTET